MVRTRKKIYTTLRIICREATDEATSLGRLAGQRD